MNNPENPDKLTSFRGVEIPQLEVDALQELENLSNKKFRKIDWFEWKTRVDSTGFRVENQRVIGIRLYGCGLSTLPESIGDLKSLQDLVLTQNKLTRLPESIRALSSLKSLRVNSNKLSFVPESIRKLKSLKHLSLEFNKFTTLPESITKIESLTFLSLSFNKLTTLPESIGNLSSLERLDLNSNKLTTLPESIGNLRSLQSLYLNDNQLTTLPESIGTISLLEELNLFENKLITLPESIGNLSLLERLNLYHNKLTTLPESTLNYTFLLKMDGDPFETNSFTQEFIDKCKGIALKSSAPHEKEFFMNIVEKLERLVAKPTFKEKIKNHIKENYLSLAYAGSIAFVGLFTYLVLDLLLQRINPVIIWIFFIGALAINLLIGASIIATLSGYFKNYIERGVNAIKSTSSEKLDYFGDWIRRRLFGLFDVFVVFYLVWAIRSVVKTGLNIELIFTVDFAFEYIIPQWLLSVWVLFSYNVELSFLENLDLFLGHFYLKLFGIALAFWALYRYGFEYMRKTEFEQIEIKNIRPFLALGLFGAFSLAIMEYNNLKQFLSIGYSVSAIIGCCLFTWESNKDNKFAFFIYLILIGGGILVVWLLSLWNLIVSVVIGAVFVISFFVVRWRIETSKTYITYEITADQNKAMKDLQRTLKEPIRPVVKIDFDTFGVKIEGPYVVGIGLYGCGLRTLPESIGNLSSLELLWLYNNKISTLPESIGNLRSLQSLYLNDNQLTTLPESIGKLKSLQTLFLGSNKLTTLPEPIGTLSSLKQLLLGDNKLSTLPESIGNLSSLESLRLYNNMLSTLPESITKLRSLTNLNLENNQLSTLPKPIENLKSLQELNLNGNLLSTLPESIGNLTSLTYLYVHDNQLSTLPESIGNLTSLQTLGLIENQLTTLPESITKLNSLKTLSLNNNKLTTLPESITKLKSLKTLLLNNNKLTTLPEFIINISSLKELNISINPLDSRAKSVLMQLIKKGVNVYIHPQGARNLPYLTM